MKKKLSSFGQKSQQPQFFITGVFILRRSPVLSVLGAWVVRSHDDEHMLELGSAKHEKMNSYPFCVIWTKFDKTNIMMIKMMTLMTIL